MKYPATIVLFVLTVCESAPPGLVGVSNKQLENLIRGALEGFKNVIQYGDEDLDLDPMEPFVMEKEWLFSYEDEDEEHEMYVTSVEDSILSGLSTYRVKNVKASMQELNATIELVFPFLEYSGKYIAKGHLFDEILPIFGRGPFNLRVENVKATLYIEFSLDASYISVEDAYVNLHIPHFHARAQNMMGIPEPYTKKIVTMVMNRICKRYKDEIDEAVSDELLDDAEYTFTGMTMKEFIDFLKYLEEKTNPTSARSKAAKLSKSVSKGSQKQKDRVI